MAVTLSLLGLLSYSQQARVSTPDSVPDTPFEGLNTFVAQNPGEGYGLLGVTEPYERAKPHDIVIYEALPNELPRAAGRACVKCCGNCLQVV